MYQKSCTAPEAKQLLRYLAEPQHNDKATIVAAAKKFGWRYSRTYNIWYGRARKVAYELEQLQRERAALKARFLSAAHAMESADPDFYCAEITALLRAARRMGGQDDT